VLEYGVQYQRFNDSSFGGDAVIYSFRRVESFECIVNGRASGAAIRTFRHNDMDRLEEIIHEAIVMGRPGLAVQQEQDSGHCGRVSMEGEYCDLKYRAHLQEIRLTCTWTKLIPSRPWERLVVDWPEVRWNTADIDIMMGTFTRALVEWVGYIAADKDHFVSAPPMRR
jgi:serine palmitoyltransferase